MDASTFRVASTTKSTRRTRWTGLIDVDGVVMKVTAVTRYSRRCTQTLAVYHRDSGRWRPVDRPEVGATQVSVAVPLAGPASDYADAYGRARARVTCATTGSNFTSYADMLRVPYAS